jgi:hypothetical protein
VAEPAATPVDPYDVGDPNHDPEAVAYPPPETPASVGQPAAASTAPPAPPEPDTRPRNPDGTFAKAPPAHPDWLVQQAAELGLYEEDLSELSTGALTRQVNRLYRERAAFGDELAKARSLANNAVRQPEPAKPIEDDLGLTPEERDELHPSILNVLKRQAQKNRDLQERLGQFADTQQKAQQSAAEARIDAGFDSLPAEYKQFVGEGPLADLTDQDARQVRLTIWQQAMSLKQGSERARIAQVAKAIYGKVLKTTPAPAQPNGYETPAAPANGAAPRITPEQWNNSGAARPTQRVDMDDEPPSEAKAIRNLKKKMDAMETPDSEILDGIPD